MWYYIYVDLKSTYIFGGSYQKKIQEDQMKVLICVLDGKYLDDILKKVEDYVKEGASLVILNIASYDMYYLNKTEEDDSLGYLYEKAVEHGAMVKVIRTNDIYRSLVNFIENEDVTDIFIEDRREFRPLHGLDKYVRESREGKIRCTFLNV